MAVATGDEVAAGDVLFDMETDKATMAVEATEDGYLAKVLVPGGTEAVKINTLVALMVEEEGEQPVDIDTAKEIPAATAPAAAAPAPVPAPTNASVAGSHLAAASAPTTRPLSPAVQRLIKANKLDQSAIPASGPKGHLLKG